MVKYSIIIPVYKHFEDCTRPCLESIIKTTDLHDVEVIVVANGCEEDDGTREYVESLGDHFTLIWFDEPLGFTRATNMGIENALGEYIILLNNDCILMDHYDVPGAFYPRSDVPTNTWINYLEQPFLEDPKMAITGPRKILESSINYYFLVFATVMIKRKFFDEFGLLDETFNPGGGEDIDFAVKIQKAGYHIRQVPFDTDEKDLGIGFPIYHAAERTVFDVPHWEEIFQSHMRIIAERYKL